MCQRCSKSGRKAKEAWKHGSGRGVIGRRRDIKRKEKQDNKIKF